MARFNPDTGVDPGREYDFKGAMPNQAGEVALKGTAGFTGDFIGAMDTAVKTDISERARAGEEGIQDNLFNTPDLAVAQSSTTNAGVAQPEDLVRGVGKMQRLKNAYAKGAITESDYLSSIDVLTKSLRNRYGDKWANEIDSAVAGAVSNSANAYRRQLFNEWDASRTASEKANDDELKRKQQFVKENVDNFHRSPDMVANPGNYSFGELASESMKTSVPKMLNEQVLQNMKVAEESGKLTDKDRLDTAKQLTASFLDTVVDRSSAKVSNKLMDMVNKYKADGTVDKDEKESLLGYLAEVEPYIQEGINRMLSKDFVTLSQPDKAEVQQMGKDQIAMFRQMVLDDQTGPLVMFSNRLNFAGQDAMLKAMNVNPSLANTAVIYKGLKDVGLDSFFAQKISETLNVEVGDVTKAPAFVLAGSLLVGEKNLNQYIQAAYDQKIGGTPVLDTFKLLRDAVTSENTATKAKAQAAAVLFNPENADVMTSGMIDGGMATRIYNELTTGDMVQTMKAMKGTDMVTWDNYYNWVFDPGFKSVFQYEINTVLPNANDVKLKFDSDTMSFSSKGVASDTRTGRAGERPGQKDTERFVERMNFWIKKVTPILESNGDDVVFEINRIFEANGIAESKDSEKQSFMQKALEAVLKEKEKQEAEEKATTIPE